MIGVILAAGDGRRLQGFVPTGLKPLILYNGRPLITRLVKSLSEVCNFVVIVVSPRNVAPIVDVLSHLQQQVHYVVQPQPNGPGDALLKVIQMCGTESNYLVLMGDNVISTDDIMSVAVQEDQGVVVGINSVEVPLPDRERFTRVWHTGKNNEGPLRSAEGTTEELDHPTVWLGPLVVPGSAACDVLRLNQFPRDGSEVKLGKHIGDICQVAGVKGFLVPVDCQDIGVPEVLE